MWSNAQKIKIFQPFDTHTILAGRINSWMVFDFFQLLTLNCELTFKPEPELALEDPGSATKLTHSTGELKQLTG